MSARITSPTIQVTPPNIRSNIRAVIRLLIGDQDKRYTQPRVLRRIDMALDMRELEGQVIEAVYWCADQTMPPTLENVIRCLEISRRLQVEDVRGFVETIVTENSDDYGGIPALSSFIQLWLKERQLAAQGAAIQAIALDPQADYSEKWEASFNMLMNVAPDDNFDMDGVSEEELEELAYRHNAKAVDDRKAGKDLGPQFPYLGMKAFFDHFKYGEVTLALGPTGSGKSTHAMILGENIAWKQKLNCDVVHFSLETPEEVLGIRQLCRYQIIPYQRVDDGYLDLREDKWKAKRETWKETRKKLNNERGYIRYFYSPTASVNDIISTMIRATEVSRVLGRSVVYIVDHLLSIDWEKTHRHMDKYSAYATIHGMLAAASNKLSKRTPNHLFVFSQEGDDKGQMFGGKMPAKRSQYVLSFSRSRFGVQDTDGKWPGAPDNLEITLNASKMSKEQKASDVVEKIKGKEEYRMLDAEGNPRFWYKKGDEYSHESEIGISKGNDNPLGRVMLKFEARMNRMTQNMEQIADMKRYGILPPDAI